MKKILWTILKRKDEPLRISEVISWWESRRLYYNIITGATGLFCLGIIFLLLGLPHDFRLYSWLVFVFIFGISANIFYTSGWIIEVSLRYGIPGFDVKYFEQIFLLTYKINKYFIY